MDFHYDNQIRRYILQFMRIFSDVHVQSDPDQNGFSLQTRVPIKWGDMSRQAAHIIAGNTENIVLSAPSMSAWITDLAIDDSRRQDTMWVSKIQADERAYEEGTGYGDEIGNRYSIERYMPVPYKLTFQLDIWTTNTQTKLQILEQLLTIFNPSIQLQQNENALDWTSIFEVFLTDVVWSNRAIPQGTDTEYDFATLKFEVPIWINPAAKETQRKVIEKIITRVFDADVDDTTGEINPGDGSANPLGSDPLAQYTITSGSLQVAMAEHPTDHALNIVTILNKHGVARNEITWDVISNTYGTIVPGESQLLLNIKDRLDPSNDDTIVYGDVISINGNEMTVMIDSDTVPPRDAVLSPITKIIDPVQMWPGGSLPVAAIGQKYLLIEDIALANPNWGGVVSDSNNVIEFNGTNWESLFDNRASTEAHVLNNEDSQFYTYHTNGWDHTLIGKYDPGAWFISNVNIDNT